MKKIAIAGMLIFNGVAFAAPLHEAGHQHAAASAPLSTTLNVTDCWIRSMPEPAPSAGYLIVNNAGTDSVNLIGASSPSFGMVMVHQTTHEGGMSKMAMTHEVPVAAGGQVVFKPGGYHLMLEKRTSKLEIGASVPVELAFSTGEKVVAQCELKPAKTLAH